MTTMPIRSNWMNSPMQRPHSIQLRLLCYLREICDPMCLTVAFEYSAIWINIPGACCSHSRASLHFVRSGDPGNTIRDGVPSGYEWRTSHRHTKQCQWW
ncbi:hypothetical protein Y032_0106g3758 [Ancylostoma ceylanicum]|uniref:Uncharacterized protein n=1 Tax=Ancylostoma ceylanicum TaxID=53326 RepID=A0A016TFZ6_9BILA|nr:hypothetical protein Y032_0106g3758 [Ancylostoma ceylanicum]